jgi:hypothetical protein
MTDCVSNLVLDQFRADPTLVPAIQCVHLEDCTRCQERLRDLEQDAKHFVAGRNVDSKVDALLRASARPMSPPPPVAILFTRTAAIAGMAAVTCMAVFFMVRGTSPDAPTERRKGGLAFDVFSRTPKGRVEAVITGQRLHPNDEIQFRVSLPKPARLGVLSIDSAGQVTAFHPVHAYDARAGFHLPGSIVLDPTLGPERLFLVACERATDTSELLAAGYRALETTRNPVAIQKLDLPCQQVSIWYEKVPR